MLDYSRGMENNERKHFLATLAITITMYTTGSIIEQENWIACEQR